MLSPLLVSYITSTKSAQKCLSLGKGPKKKLQKFGHMSKLFATKKVWTKIFRVGRSDINVHTYKSMQSPKYGDGMDLFPVIGRDFFHP